MANKKPTGIYLITGIFALMGLWNIISGALLMTSSNLLATYSTYLIGIGMLAGVFILMFGIVQFVVAYGVWMKESWAEPAVIFMAILGLFLIPVGTLLSLIVIVALFTKDVKSYW